MGIRNISVSRRLLISYLLMSILPLAVFAVLFYRVGNDAILSKTSRYTGELLTALGENLSNEVSRYVKFAREIMALDDMQTGLRCYFDWTSMQKNRFIHEKISPQVDLRLGSAPDIRETFVLDADNHLIYSQGFILYRPEELERLLSLHEQGVNWLSVSISRQNYIAYVQAIPTISGMYDIGHMIVLIDPDAFYRRIASVDLGTGATVFVTDSQGGCVVSQGRVFPRGGQVDETLRLMEREAPDGGVIESYSFQGRPSMIAYAGLRETGWFVSAAIPESYLRSETWQLRRAVVILITVCLLVSFLVYRLIWRSITKPIERLVLLVGQSAEEKFAPTLVDDNRDELGFLGRAYVQIIRKMKDLVSQVELEQRGKREFEIKMLQAQINPHFLFNTLNSLRWTALMSRASNVAAGLGALSDLLKNTIVDKNEFIPIEEELKNIDNYVTIQRLRYGGVFAVEQQVPPALGRCYTLKFLLQPIVENSIIHGIDEQREDNRILIRVRRQGERLVFTISDNGRGFDTSRPRQDLTQKRLSGIGVDNVAERVRLHFGESYAFHIESQVGAGTTVTIETPVLDAPPGQADAEGSENL